MLIFQHAAPGHPTPIGRSVNTTQLFSNGRMNTVSTNEQINGCGFAVFKEKRHVLVVLFKANESMIEMKVIG